MHSDYRGTNPRN
ncbi:UNVERIFIED_CONTAM: hypothetical protein GTU68_017205 [Idotea baltica]|nr:hypothetical protein [Idotea baltica]